MVLENVWTHFWTFNRCVGENVFTLRFRFFSDQAFLTTCTRFSDSQWINHFSTFLFHCAHMARTAQLVFVHNRTKNAFYTLWHQYWQLITTSQRNLNKAFLFISFEGRKNSQIKETGSEFLQHYSGGQRKRARQSVEAPVNNFSLIYCFLGFPRLICCEMQQWTWR